MSRGQSQSRIRSGKRTLERCKEKFKTDNIVFIDVDSDNVHDVIIVDVPESSKQPLQGSRSLKDGKNSIPSSVISIDDDYISDDENPGNCVEGSGDIDSDATSSKGSLPASSELQNSVESDSSECQFVQGKKTPVKLSKCKRTYSRETQSRNRYGFNPLFDSSSSENDSSDGEVVEDSSGEIREQWQKAYLKKKKKLFEDVRNDQSGLEDQASASGSQTDTRHDAEVETEADQHVEVPLFPSSCNGNNEKEKFSNFTATGDGTIGDTFLNTDGVSSGADFCPSFEQERPIKCKSQSCEKPQCCNSFNVHDGGETFSRDPFLRDTVGQSDTYVYHGQTRSTDEEVCQGSRFSFSEKQGEKFNHVRTCFQDKEENIPVESCLFGAQSGYTMHSDYSKANSEDDVESLDKSQVNQDGGVSCDKDEGIHHEHFFPGIQLSNESKFERSGSEEAEKLVSGGLSSYKTQLCDETQVNHGVACSEGKVGQVPGGTFFGNPQFWGEAEVSYDRNSCQVKDKPVFDESPSLDETLINRGSACLKENIKEAMSKTQLEDTGDLLHPPNEGRTPDVQNDLIGEREKLKETDDYKRAAEEEWASRQRQLQIQAEEAQKLRKRKKAEAMRLLDMERRQRQRVEEMRETLKKGEETIKQKEQIRAEIRKELDNLEARCIDMASLLRGLGIRVGGGFCPLSHEVHAAYKQALLRFHPDRASKTDICQLVEAEEKFKLISRAKEKLLLTA